MRFIWLFTFIGVCVYIQYADALLAAMAVDFGNEYMKIALVKPGVPMEMVLNRESKRKTRTMLSIRNEEREFGDNAMTVRLRYPKNSYAYVVELLGKKFDHPFVEQFQKWFPFHKLVPDPNRGTVLFVDDGRTFSPEELVAQLLAECRDLAENFGEQPVRDVVITVPAFWTQAERRAMVKAAEIADLNLLQLLNDNTAAGINYGMFRRKEFNETATRVLIYDMGALKTTATVFEYQLVKDSNTKEKDPQMTVLGVGYDRTLGGFEMTVLFRDHLAKLFQEQHGKKAKSSIFDSDRAMLKLLKEAERVKQVLSANQDHFAQVEGLHEDIDFRTKVTREDLDTLCSSFYDRVPGPLNEALKMAELGLESIDYVVLMGAGTRSLKVQEKLQAAVKGRDLGKYLNTDEAVAMGAVYQAAHRSKGFKVKKFIVKDITLFPIQVDFPKELNASTADATNARIIHRTLFGFKNPFPQKKVMTFNKHTHDFEFFVNYGDLTHLKKEQLSYFGEFNITRVDLRDIEKALKSKEGEGAECKGIKVHFRVDEGGLFSVDTAEVIFERKVTEGENETDGMEKIGKTLSNLFGGGDEKKEPEAEGKDKDKESKEHEKKPSEKKEKAEKSQEKEEKAEKKSEEKADKDKDKTKEETKDKTKEETKDKTKEETKDKAKEETKKDKKEKVEEKKSEKKETKPKVIKVQLKLDKAALDLPDMPVESSKEAVERLKTFQKLEKSKRDREKAHNTLEAFLFETNYKLDESEYKKISTEAERDAIRQKLKEASEWLEEQGVGTATKDFEDKLKTLKDFTKELFYKFEEQKERPRAIEAMKQMLNYSSVFLAGMKNLTEDIQIFTETEISTLEKLVNDTEKWWKDLEQKQAKLAAHEKPIVTLMGVAEKVQALDREVKYLLNKAKFAKPKTKKTTEEGKNDTESTGETKNETETEQEAEKTKTEEVKPDGDDQDGEVADEEPIESKRPSDGEDKHEEL